MGPGAIELIWILVRHASEEPWREAWVLFRQGTFTATIENPVTLSSSKQDSRGVAGAVGTQIFHARAFARAVFQGRVARRFQAFSAAEYGSPGGTVLHRFALFSSGARLLDSEEEFLSAKSRIPTGRPYALGRHPVAATLVLQSSTTSPMVHEICVRTFHWHLQKPFRIVFRLFSQ